MDLPQLFLRLLLHQAVQLFVVLDQRCREQTDVETQRVVVGAETHRATEKRFVRRAVRGRSMLETGIAHPAAAAGDPAPEPEPPGTDRLVTRPHTPAARQARNR